MPAAEVSTALVVQDALRHGKKVFVPYISKIPTPVREERKNIMDMVSLLDWQDYEGLERDGWGIPTPGDDSIWRRERCLADAGGLEGEQGGGDEGDWGVDLVVMPGMVFDRGLRRLGHGKGFYDSFLQRYQQRLTVGANGTRKMPFLGEITLLVLMVLSKLTLILCSRIGTRGATPAAKCGGPHRQFGLAVECSDRW